MRNYLVKTPVIIQSSPPYASCERVFVRAENPEQARELAVRLLSSRASVWVIACMIDGVDPRNELIVIDHRTPVDSFDPFDERVLEPEAFDIRGAAQAANLATKLRGSEDRVQKLGKVCAVGLSIFVFVMLAMLTYTLNLKDQNDQLERELPDFTKRNI